MSINETIVNYISKNRVSTTEVADALNKQGCLTNVKPVNEGHYAVGKVHCIFTGNNSNSELHQGLPTISDNDVVIVFVENCDDRAVLGELVAKFVLLYRGARALVVNGLIRDVAAIRRENFAVWSIGSTPIGCFNTPANGFSSELKSEILKRYEGSIAVCDDGGVVVIENEYCNEEMLDRLKLIELQEDIWFFCLDTLKWDTHKIVCEKAYLDNRELIPSIYLSQLDELKRKPSGD